MAQRVRVKSQVVRKDNPQYQRLMAELRGAKGGLYVKAGYLGAGGTVETDEGDITMPQLAAVHEFGNPPRIPERPHVGPAFDRNLSKYQHLLAVLLGRWMDGHLGLQQALGLLGLEMVADIRNLVTEGPEVPPTNADSTRARKEARTRKGAKGDVRTLVDTGRMIGSLTHVVLAGLANRPKKDG